MLGESFTRGNAISEMQYCIRCESNRARPVTQTILDITKGDKAIMIMKIAFRIIYSEEIVLRLRLHLMQARR